jgi:1-deoxy-D-xylulose-5-phosphate synthase
VRYPRGSGPGADIDPKLDTLTVGKAETLRQGKNVAILAFGSMVEPARNAAEALDATLVNMRFVKPLDATLVQDMARTHDMIVTVEENALMGGAGSAVSECLHQAGLSTAVLQLGLPDTYIDHGKPKDLLASVGLDAQGILASIQHRMTSD